MNDKELKADIDFAINSSLYRISNRALRSTYINTGHVFEAKYELNKEMFNIIKQDQALREIDIRTDELKNAFPQLQKHYGISNSSVENYYYNDRIAELQAQKDKLIKGVE